MLSTLLPLAATWRLSSTSCPNLETAGLTWTRQVKAVSTMQCVKAIPKWCGTSLRKEVLTLDLVMRLGGMIAIVYALQTVIIPHISSCAG